MGVVVWPGGRRVSKRKRKFRAHDVPLAQEEARWQCQTCENVIASNDDIYCLHCKLYWKDVSEGLFDDLLL